MKLLLLIATVVQICSSASIVKRSPEPKTLTSEDIQRIGNRLSALHLNPDAIDNFTNILYGFRDEAVDAEIFDSIAKLMGFALNVDAAKMNETISELFKENEGATTDDSTSSEIFFDENDLKVVEETFSKVMTESQTKHAMELLQGFRQKATFKEAFRNLMKLAANNLFGIKSKPKTTKSFRHLEYEIK